MHLPLRCAALVWSGSLPFQWREVDVNPTEEPSIQIRPSPEAPRHSELRAPEAHYAGTVKVRCGRFGQGALAR